MLVVLTHSNKMLFMKIFYVLMKVKFQNSVIRKLLFRSWEDKLEAGDSFYFNIFWHVLSKSDVYNFKFKF